MIFTGDPRQRIDGKGRFLLPAKMRDVLDQGSNGRTQGGTSTAILNYGDHLDRHLRLYPLAEWAVIEAKILAMDEGSDDRLLNEYVYLTQNQPVESDREGRFVLPAKFREKLGVDEGDVLLLGKGTYVAIWNPETHATTEGKRIKDMLAQRGPGFDPISLAKKQVT